MWLAVARATTEDGILEKTLNTLTAKKLEAESLQCQCVNSGGLVMTGGDFSEDNKSEFSFLCSKGVFEKIL